MIAITGMGATIKLLSVEQLLGRRATRHYHSLFVQQLLISRAPQKRLKQLFPVYQSFRGGGGGGGAIN